MVHPEDDGAITCGGPHQFDRPDRVDVVVVHEREMRSGRDARSRRRGRRAPCDPEAVGVRSLAFCGSLHGSSVVPRDVSRTTMISSASAQDARVRSSVGRPRVGITMLSCHTHTIPIPHGPSFPGSVAFFAISMYRTPSIAFNSAHTCATP